MHHPLLNAIFRTRPTPASREPSPASLQNLEPRRMFATTPNDPDYASQWGLANANVQAVWDLTTGSASVIVAHLDTGIDYTHPDLYLNVWINQAEIPKSVRKSLTDADDDGLITFHDLNHRKNKGKVADVNKSGYIDAGDLLADHKKSGKGGWADRVNGAAYKGESYIDDLVGWDFANNDNDPFDDEGHGTHTAGIIGATGDNNVGVAGVAWQSSLMSLKILDSGGAAPADGIIARAIKYSARAGANVSNNSWSSYDGKIGGALYNAIQFAGSQGQVFVAAAGNDENNNDSEASRWTSYPASFDLDNIISVAASTPAGTLASFSNQGRQSVDLAAPGSNVVSTAPDGKYAPLSGTSMAAPYVTGTIALLLAQDPNRTIAELKRLVMVGADETSGLARTSVTGAELNISNALTNTAGTETSENPNQPSFGRRTSSRRGRGLRSVLTSDDVPVTD